MRRRNSDGTTPPLSNERVFSERGGSGAQLSMFVRLLAGHLLQQIHLAPTRSSTWRLLGSAWLGSTCDSPAAWAIYHAMFGPRAGIRLIDGRQ